MDAHLLAFLGDNDLKHQLQTVLNTVLGPDATRDEVRSFVRGALAGSVFQAGQETRAAFILRSVIEKLNRQASGSDRSNEAWHAEASVWTSREDTHTPVHVDSPPLCSAPTSVSNGIIEEGVEERDDGVVRGGIDCDIDDEDMHRDIDHQDMHHVDDSARSWHARPVNPFSPLCTLSGHSCAVWGLAWALDGSILASCSEDGTVKLWFKDGSLKNTLIGHSGVVFSVAVSGNVVASGSGDKTVRLWDITNGNVVGFPLIGHSDWVLSVAVAGNLVASGSRDTTVRIWDIKTGDPVGSPLRGHSKDVCGLAFSPTRILVSCSKDKSIIAWDLNTGSAKFTLRGHEHYVSCLAFSQSGLLASGSWDKTVKGWDIQAGTLLWTLRGHTKDNSECICQFHARGHLEDSIPECPVRGHSGAVYCIAVSGNIVASGSSDKTVRLGDITNGSPIGSPLTGHSAEVLSVAFPLPWLTLLVQQEINIASQHKDKYRSRFFVLPSNCLRRILDFLGIPLASAASEHGMIKIWNISTVETK